MLSLGSHNPHLFGHVHFATHEKTALDKEAPEHCCFCWPSITFATILDAGRVDPGKGATFARRWYSTSYTSNICLVNLLVSITSAWLLAGTSLDRLHELESVYGESQMWDKTESHCGGTPGIVGQ